MEKLSERFMFYSGLLAAYKINHPNVDIDINADDLKYIQDLIDAEEQGLLLRLPCKLGEIVYVLKQVSYCPVGTCHKQISCTECRAKSPYRVKEKKFTLDKLEEIGKTVFLTREEAEQALEQMGEV